MPKETNEQKNRQTSLITPCAHHILRQTSYGAYLPPLYFTSTPSPDKLSFLAHSLSDLSLISTVKSSPFIVREALNLRHELEDGMSRKRRLLLQSYVMDIEDPREKAVVELYLARYAGFVLDGDGRLVFEVEELGGDKSGRNEDDGMTTDKWSWNWCVVM